MNPGPKPRPTGNDNIGNLSHTISVNQEKSFYCYYNGKISPAIQSADQCKKPGKGVILYRSRQKTIRSLQVSNAPINFKSVDLEKIINNNGGTYTGKAIFCKNGELLKGSSCSACKSSKEGCQVIEVKMGGFN